jgi:hypothetical protein
MAMEIGCWDIILLVNEMLGRELKTIEQVGLQLLNEEHVFRQMKK